MRENLESPIVVALAQGATSLARTESLSLPCPSTLPVGLVLQQTGAYIEPLTRFTQADLKELAPEVHSHLVAVVTCIQRVNIRTKGRINPGPMSPQAINGMSSSEVDENTRKLGQAALAALPDRIKAWGDLDDSNYRRLLPERPFLGGFTEFYAHEYRCGKCHGARDVTCGTCAGQRYTTCTTCKGLGETACGHCRGEGRGKCTICNGQGSGYRYEYVSEWDPEHNMNVTVNKQVYRSCSCVGGYNMCGYCLNGQVQCHTCHGQRTVSCSGCNATGKRSCKTCTGKGVLHYMGYIESEVSTEEKLELKHPETAVLALGGPHLTIPELMEKAQLTSVSHQAHGAQVTSTYVAEIAVTHGKIVAAGIDFSIFGFGPQTEIYDYQNIAGILLQRDVDVLEAAVAESSTWRVRGSEAVLQATSDFVKSELNLVIAESATDASATATSVASSVESKFKGLVDQAYITRASQLFKRVIGRIYMPLVLAPGLNLTCLAVLVTAASYGFRWPTRSWAFPLGLSIGLLGWCVIEFAKRRRIRKLFSGLTGARMLAQVDASGLPKRLRWMALAIWMAGSLAAVMAINTLPHERERQAKEASALFLHNSVSVWRTGLADLRLRSYPSLALLREGVANGNEDAAVVLGWQLVLGAGGMRKDVLEATRLFNTAAAQMPRDPLVQTGQVVALLDKEATPQAFRDSLSTLRQAESEGLVEARYWRARFQLSKQSPVRDLREGLKAMSEAADAGHASAALEMARRFASGDGVRADNRKTKHYLQLAATYGIPEAQAELNRRK